MKRRTFPNMGTRAGWAWVRLGMLDRMRLRLWGILP